MDDRAGVPCDAEDCCAGHEPRVCWRTHMYCVFTRSHSFELTFGAGRDPEYLDLAIQFGQAILIDRQFLKEFPVVLKRFALLFARPTACMLT